MSDLRREILDFDLLQLISLRDFVGGLIDKKKREQKKTVWRVCSRGLCYGNFRENEYLSAARFLLEQAKRVDANDNNDRLDRELEIISEIVPESEYEDYFND